MGGSIAQDATGEQAYIVYMWTRSEKTTLRTTYCRGHWNFADVDPAFWRGSVPTERSES